MVKIKESEESKQKQNDDSMSILEDALVICEFGKFHIQLIMLTFAACSSIILVNLTTSYILPIAECDLNMDNTQKGLLNSIPFFGLTATTMLVSFLNDTFGRKPFLIYGLLGTFVCRVIQGASQNFTTMLIGKFLEGVFSSFGFPGALVMLSETLHRNVRDRAMLFNSTLFSVTMLMTSFMSWAILPQKWDFVLIEGYFEIHSWSIYLYICSLWGLIAGVGYCFFPESPKYLLSCGEKDEALEVLKHIYSVNTGKDKNSFPIKSLSNYQETFTGPANISFRKKVVDGLFEVKFLFKKPLFMPLFGFSIMASISFLVQYTLLAWYPQISTVVENYQQKYNKTDNFCCVITNYTDSLPDRQINENISYLTNNNTFNVAKVCQPHISGSDTYISSLVMGGITLISSGFSTYIVKLISLKLLICVLFLSSSACLIALYWMSTAMEIAMLLSATCGLLQSCFNVQLNWIVEIFPTSLRSLAMAVIFMLGRMAIIVGNNLFPVMLNWGCMVPFLAMSVLMICTTCLIFVLPESNNTSEGTIKKT